MVLVCPECGCTGDAAVFASDGAYKEALLTVVRLPREVQAQLVAYLGLFRPPKKSLTGPRTLRVVRELAELVAAGDVVGLDRQPPKRCPPATWAEAMRQMVERKGGGGTHMQNHNYLRAVAWDLANQADARRESATRSAEKQHVRPQGRAEEAAETPGDAAAAGLTDAARAEIAQIKQLMAGIGRTMK